MSLPLPSTSGRTHDFVRPAVSRQAVAGFVLGLLSFLFGIFASVPAFVCAARGLAEINRDPVHVKGRARALVGIFAAGLGMFAQPLLLLLGVQVARDRVVRATDAANLHRIGEAMYAHNDERGRLPPAASKDENGRPLLSWRVALLPYLGEKSLYEHFHRDEPWDSPHNFALVGRMPRVYAHPADPDAAAQGLTYYRVFVGPATPFDDSEGPKLPDSFHGGTKNMFLVVAAAEPVPWTKPDELLYDPARPVAGLGGLLGGGYNVLCADGRVHFLPQDVRENRLREAIDGVGPAAIGEAEW
jgi:hypothetical protein